MYLIFIRSGSYNLEAESKTKKITLPLFGAMKGGSKFKLRTGSLGVSWTCKYCESGALSRTLSQAVETVGGNHRAWRCNTGQQAVAVGHCLLPGDAVLCPRTVRVLEHGCGQRQGTKWRKPGDIRVNYCYTASAGPVLYSVFLHVLAKIICKIDSVSTISLTKRLHSLSMNWTYFCIFRFY